MPSRPLAQILRSRRISSNTPSATLSASMSPSIASISERITALEQELQPHLPPPSSSPSSSFSSSLRGGGGDGDRHLIEERDQGGAVLRVVSSLLADRSLRIEPLPLELLPAARCGSRLGFSKGPGTLAGNAERGRGVRFSEDEDGPPQRKRARPSATPFHSHPPSPASSSGGGSVEADSKAAVLVRSMDAGLLRTVKELVLDNYRPAERVPFYCRLCRLVLFPGQTKARWQDSSHFCRFKASDLAEWEEHRSGTGPGSEMHRLAVALERSHCRCDPCGKTFTSADQMKEHLRGKLHRERLGELK